MQTLLHIEKWRENIKVTAALCVDKLNVTMDTLVCLQQ